MLTLNLTNVGEAKMNRIKLVFPTIAMEKDALEFKMKFYNNGEKTIFGSYKVNVAQCHSRCHSRLEETIILSISYNYLKKIFRH